MRGLRGIGLIRFPAIFLKLVRKSTKFYATIILPDGVSDPERMQQLVCCFLISPSYHIISRSCVCGTAPAAFLQQKLCLWRKAAVISQQKNSARIERYSSIIFSIGTPRALARALIVFIEAILRSFFLCS